jgi:hypothetical protein
MGARTFLLRTQGDGDNNNNNNNNNNGIWRFETVGMYIILVVVSTDQPQNTRATQNSTKEPFISITTRVGTKGNAWHRMMNEPKTKEKKMCENLSFVTCPAKWCF